MEFKHISVKNFRGIASLEADIKPVNVLVGPNGKGKSSFLQAFKIPLVGEQSRGSIIKYGESSADITLTLDSYELKKTYTKGKGSAVYLNGKKTTQKSIVEMLETEYGASKESMKFLTSSEIFEKASGSDFTEFLLTAGLIPLTLDADKFIKVCEEVAPLDPVLESQIRGMLPEAPNTFEFPLINELADKVASKLKTVKGELKGYQAQIALIDAIDSSTVRDYNTVKTEYNNIIAEEAAANERASIERKVAQMQDEINRLAAQITADTSVRPNPTTKIAAQKTVEEQQEQIVKSSKLKASFEQNNKILQEQLVRLDTDRCPLSDLITCTVDKTSLKAQIASQIEDNEAQIIVIDTDLEIAQEQRNAAQATLQKYEDDLTAYQRKLRLVEQHKKLVDNLPALPAGKPYNPVELNEKKLKLEKEMELAQKLASGTKLHTMADQTQSQINLLTAMEEIFSKKGSVQKKILGILSSSLVTAINSMAATVCPHLSVDLGTNELGNIVIQVKNSTGVQDYGDLSTGEKLMIQFLIMAQINQLSGFRVMVLDNLDKLDSQNFEHMLEFLQSPAVAGIVDYVFVATVDHQDFLDVLAKPTMSGVNVIRV